MSQVGQVQENANCSAHHRWGTLPVEPDHVGGTRVLAFQNAFLLGQALERHLGELASINSDESFPPEQQKIGAFAAAASCLAHSIQGDFNLSTRSEIEALMRGSRSGRVIR